MNKNKCVLFYLIVAVCIPEASLRRIVSSAPDKNYVPRGVRRRRTAPSRLSFAEDCDYIAYYCMRVYDTGTLCGRTMYHVYHDFTNYCLLDYVNCMERFEVWQVAHMGHCLKLEPLLDYRHYPYENDYFLDDYYINVEDVV